MAATLADCLMNVAERRPLGSLTDRLMITGPLTYEGPVDGVSYSGGVSEYIYGNETRNFGDLGILLGRAVNARSGKLGVSVDSAEQTIRATVIGAAQYTLQVSGSTIWISRPELLPHRNLQVVAPVQPEGTYTRDSVEAAIAQAMQRVDVTEGEQAVALSFRWRMDPSYDRVKTLADGIARALPRTIEQKLPVILVFDTDIGGAVGSMLTREVVPGHDLICIDEVDVGDLDYVDLGEELEDVNAVPVVVKSLVFSTARERASGLVRGTLVEA
jgi:ethanolamine utilization protein EutA